MYIFIEVLCKHEKNCFQIVVKKMFLVHRKINNLIQNVVEKIACADQISSTLDPSQLSHGPSLSCSERRNCDGCRGRDVVLNLYGTMYGTAYSTMYGMVAVLPLVVLGDCGFDRVQKPCMVPCTEPCTETCTVS